MSDVEQPVKQNEGFRISQMPATLREDAMALVKEFDANGDGCVDKHEFANAVKALKESRTKTSQYAKIIAGLSVSGALLIASMFGVSLVASRLSKDTTVSGFGVVLDKNTNMAVNTGEAIEYHDESGASLRVVDMSPVQLMNLKHIVLLGGELFFNVKGHVKAPAGDKVIILVEGGTITYDGQGILDATGDPRYMLDVAFGVIDIDNTADEEIESDPEEVAEEPGDRKLFAVGHQNHYYAYANPRQQEDVCRRRVLREKMGEVRWRRLCGGSVSSAAANTGAANTGAANTGAANTGAANTGAGTGNPIPDVPFSMYGLTPSACRPVIGKGNYAIC